MYPSGVQGAQVRKDDAHPEEQGLGYALSVPQTARRCSVGDEPDTLHQRVGDNRILGNHPEHDNPSPANKTPALHAVESNNEAATTQVESTDPTENADRIQNPSYDGDVTRPGLVRALPVHGAG